MPKPTAPRDTVNGCRHCGLPMRLSNGWPHSQRWTEGVGFHSWTPPTQEQIEARRAALEGDRTDV